MPNSIAVHETETTDEIVFVGFDSDVDTDQFTLKLRTRLFHRERFTITRKTRNERWIEKTGINNFFDIIKITKLDEGIIFLRNKILFGRRNHSRRLESAFDFFNLFLSHFKIPLGTTHLKRIKTLGYSLIRNIFRCTETTNISCRNSKTKSIFEIGQNLVVGHLKARHV